MDFSGIKFSDFKSRIESIKYPYSIDWNGLKIIPQSFRRKAKIGVFTIDEQFDELHRTLGIVEASIKNLIKYSDMYTANVTLQLKSAKEIGDLFSSLCDPYISFDQQTRNEVKDMSLDKIVNRLFTSEDQTKEFMSQCFHFKVTESFIVKVQELIEVVGDPTEVSKTITSKCQVCLFLLENIKRFVRKRNHALDNYDYVVSQIELLLKKSKEKFQELSVKESQKLFNLQRRLEVLRSEYDTINTLLLKELPSFFHMVDSLLSPIKYLLYYNQLIFNYQTISKMLEFQEKSRIALQWDLDSIDITEFQQRIESLSLLQTTRSVSNMEIFEDSPKK
ncbi:hypothetical protein PSN45_004955 [Yamadazyma tenuis]|uniref:BAR domain-containing protein n=1 Tax=Candida tenuis (strain ATCC 10573 / BCRC 21748 / CBS 615 / JCM 9827 / NBRC 10315 / NRRL Y-1498 / VKM Y-70) TaxID=590646 RepID=G3B297_CANTC|nr:uncharacterized protein CANTEDRAFT_92867 [Yamadazyma tenuis ATCC 10573]EGV64625.1 hypothetical protein CANTEDRAFT_92867 [Yamadazyma tenuis ATCC 10573]WEJ97404.1 hypothetical protein PSN45_004955 [Yamadazyma tenuis]